LKSKEKIRILEGAHEVPHVAGVPVVPSQVSVVVDAALQVHGERPLLFGAVATLLYSPIDRHPLLFGAVATRSDAGGHHRRLLPRAAAAAVAAGAVVSSPRRGGGSAHNHRRWAPAPFRACLLALWLLGFALIFLWQSTSVGRVWLYTRPPMPKHAVASLGQWAASPPVYDLREFGAGRGRADGLHGRVRVCHHGDRREGRGQAHRASRAVAHRAVQPHRASRAGGGTVHQGRGRSREGRRDLARRMSRTRI
jgi:hypothetical protein